MALGRSRRGAVAPFEVMQVVERVATLRAAGRDVLNLCVGEPIAGAPRAVRRALAQALRDDAPPGAGLGYSPALGLPELREAVAAHYGRWYGIEVAAANVTITTGSSGAFLLGFLACFDAGSRVALARPGYPAYANILRSLDVEGVELDVATPRADGAPPDYRLTAAMLEAAHRERPLDGLVVASPANPTGTMMSAESLGEVSRWCREHGVRLVSDEIYHGITADGSRGACAWNSWAGQAAAGQGGPGSRDALVVSSFSKYWGMTGWRIGWMLVPDELVGAVDALAGNLALCAPVPSQLAALAAFGPEAEQEAAAAVVEYDRARAVVQEAATRLGWLAAPADGAFYLYADISASLRPGEDSRAWCAALLDEAGVALTPGWDFDGVRGGTTVRLSLSVGAGVAGRAMRRTEAWLERRDRDPGAPASR